MEYNFTGLNLAVVQRILTDVNQVKNDLAHRKYNLEYDVNGDAQQTARDEADLQMYTQQNAALLEQIAALPEGSEKRKKMIEQSRLVTRILTLQGRLSVTSGLSLPERQYSIATIDARIAESDEFIAALQNKITELGG